MYKTYGTSTTYSNGRTSFKEFETEDLAELKAEFMKLDKVYGFENLKVVMELDFSVDVDIFKSIEVPTVTTAPSEEIEDTKPVEDESKNEEISTGEESEDSDGEVTDN
jgi:hypothetical protein